MTAFHRARSEEQRAVRRAAILDAAATMLDEVGVADLSLNELARRVGLAKSNVLRYFDSREAVLLELLAGHFERWLADLTAAAPGTRGSLTTRSARLVDSIAESLQQRPVLCDLINAQAAVLERNVSVEVAVQHKRSSLASLRALADYAERLVPELGPERAQKFALGVLLTAGALWAHAQPCATMVAAYQAYPELQVIRIDFADNLRELVAVLLAGLLARDA